MAPEQLEGQEADARTRHLRAGRVLYEMATGKRAFEGKSRASLIAAIMQPEPPPISSIAPMSPPALDRIVRKCLAKDPDERCQTAHDVGRGAAVDRARPARRRACASPVAVRRRSRESLAWSLAALGGAAVIVPRRRAGARAARHAPTRVPREPASAAGTALVP